MLAVAAVMLADARAIREIGESLLIKNAAMTMQKEAIAMLVEANRLVDIQIEGQQKQIAKQLADLRDNDI